MGVRSSIHHSYNTGEKQEHPSDFYSTVSSRLVRLLRPNLALSVIVTATTVNAKVVKPLLKFCVLCWFPCFLVDFWHMYRRTKWIHNQGYRLFSTLNSFLPSSKQAYVFSDFLLVVEGEIISKYSIAIPEKEYFVYSRYGAQRMTAGTETELRLPLKFCFAWLYNMLVLEFFGF